MHEVVGRSREPELDTCGLSGEEKARTTFFDIPTGTTTGHQDACSIVTSIFNDAELHFPFRLFSPESDRCVVYASRDCSAGVSPTSMSGSSSPASTSLCTSLRAPSPSLRSSSSLSTPLVQLCRCTRSVASPDMLSSCKGGVAANS